MPSDCLPVEGIRWPALSDLMQAKCNVLVTISEWDVLANYLLESIAKVGLRECLGPKPYDWLRFSPTITIINRVSVNQWYALMNSFFGHSIKKMKNSRYFSQSQVMSKLTLLTKQLILSYFSALLHVWLFGALFPIASNGFDQCFSHSRLTVRITSHRKSIGFKNNWL